MDRYQNVVRYSSFGHTHQEDFQITQSFADSKQIGFNFIAGSGTTWGSANPGFTVIDFDEEFMVPVNIHTYAMDLSAANANPTKPIEFKKIHDWLSEYQLKDLSPDTLAQLADRLYSDIGLANRYEANRFKGGNPSAKAQANDKKYKCFKATEEFEQRECMGQADESLSDSSTYFDMIVSNWIIKS